MTWTGAGFKMTLARRRFAARGVSMHVSSCQITYTLCSRLPNRTLPVGCRRFCPAMRMCGRVATSFPGMFSRAGIGPNWWKMRRTSGLVTRYVHLNPVRAGMVEHPTAWAWSSYSGYAHRARRLEWLAYDDLLASWTGAFGGSDPAGTYRRYVTAGLSEPPQSPWKDAYHGWVLGSGAFNRPGQGDGAWSTSSRAAPGVTAHAECAALKNY
jgi:hypothetical protein